MVVVSQFMVGVGGEVKREKEVYLPKRERKEELYPLEGEREEEVFPLEVARCKQLHCLFA